MQKAIALVVMIMAVSSSLQNTVESEVKPAVDPEAQSKYVIPYFKANWYKAVEYCNYLGLRLAQIDSEETDTKLMEAIKASNIYGRPCLRLWAGASDLADEGQFHWHDTGKRVAYSKWFGGQPDNAKDAEHCLEVGFYNYKWGWNDMECKSNRYFVCE